jgi:hypothetical protein
VNWVNSKYGWLLANVGALEPGKAHQAQKGSHFTCEARSFAGYVYAAAAERGYKATVAVFERLPHPVVVFAFYRPTDLMRPNLAAYPVVKKLRKHGA